MTTILLDKLHKRYGMQVAVAETTLQLPSGKFVVFLGPSGCGKTTTLNCIAGFEAPSSGRVLFDGADVTYLPPHGRNIAMVFQSALLYPHLSAQANIEMSLRHSNISASTRQQHIDHAVDMLHIRPLLHKRPAALSGGERQRVALAKAMVRQPSVFLMDEPFSALDAALRHSLRSEIVLLQKRLAVTTVFVTHDQIEAMTMGDLIVVMNNGAVQQVGTPNDIYERPANRFVASFIGSPPMNLVDGHVSALPGGSCLFEAQGMALHIGAGMLHWEKALGSKQAVCLGVRPHHIALCGEAEANVSAQVITIERLGKENVVIAQAESGVWRVITEPSVRLGIGDIVHLKLDIQKLLAFE